MKKKTPIKPIVCKAQPVRFYTKEKRELAVRNTSSGHWKIWQAAEETGCSESAVKKWRRDYKKGKTWYNHAHRPSYVSPERKKALKKEVERGSCNTVKMSQADFVAKLQQAADSTWEENNVDKKSLSRRFVREYMAENDIHVGKGQVVDNAHLVALKDPRHAASHAALMKILHESVPNNLFFNLDKTSFEMRAAEKETAPTVYTSKRDRSLKCEDPYTAGAHGNCSVHLYLVANSGGKLGDLVYVVKDKYMPKDKIDVHEAPILDATANPCATSYVVFVGESTSNKDACSDWLFRNVVVPFMVRVRTHAKRGVEVPASLTVDGDPRQLQVISSEGIRAEFLKANIIASKSPASCTPIYQPLDVGKLFLASKTVFRDLIARNYVPEDKEEVSAVKEIFLQHLRNYPQKHKKDGAPSMAISSYFRDVQICLLAMVESLRRTVTTEKIKKSFKEAGVSPFNAEHVRQLCQYEWTAADKKQFHVALPELSRRMKVNFELCEKDFDDCMIPVNNKPKDGAPVHQRRALFLHKPRVDQDLATQAAKREKKGD